ncbi:MAG: tryptophan synthase subunit alpha, partial [Plesiomonas shigelloides]
ESLPFRVAAQAHGIETIFICPPNANSATLQSVATCSQGYTYLLSRAGVTGAEQKAVMPLEHIMAQLRDHNAPPALLGFGIAEPAQVKAALDAGAAGAISGSAVVKIIEQYQTQPEQMLQHLHAFVQAMKAATHRG